MNDLVLEKLYVQNRLENLTAIDLLPIFRPGAANAMLGASNLADLKAYVAPGYKDANNTQTFSMTTATAITTTSNTVINSNALALKVAGTYLITAEYIMEYAAATFAAAQTVTLKLRRTNNTAADIESRSLKTEIITTGTKIFSHGTIIGIVTTTSSAPTTPDAISVTGSIGTLPSAGALNFTNIQLKATRLIV